jgi:hypothetical protein
LWNALRTSYTPLAGEGLPALGRLERSATTPGGRVRILLRELLMHGAAFDEAGWDMITEALTIQMKLLTDQPLKVAGLEFTPAAEAPAAAGGVPRNSITVPTVQAIAGTIQSAKGETHAATLILECLEKNGRKFDVSEVLRMVAEKSDPQRELKSVQAAAQLIFVGATRPTHLLVFAAHRDRGKRYAETMIDAGWYIRDLTER